MSVDTPSPRQALICSLSVDLPALDVSHKWDRTPRGLCEHLSLSVTCLGPIRAVRQHPPPFLGCDISPWTDCSLSTCPLMGTELLPFGCPQSSHEHTCAHVITLRRWGGCLFSVPVYTGL